MEHKSGSHLLTYYHRIPFRAITVPWGVNFWLRNRVQTTIKFALATIIAFWPLPAIKMFQWTSYYTYPIYIIGDRNNVWFVKTDHGFQFLSSLDYRPRHNVNIRPRTNTRVHDMYYFSHQDKIRWASNTSRLLTEGTDHRFEEKNKSEPQKIYSDCHFLQNSPEKQVFKVALFVYNGPGIPNSGLLPNRYPVFTQSALIIYHINSGDTVTKSPYHFAYCDWYTPRKVSSGLETPMSLG